MPVQEWPLDKIRDNPFQTRTIYDESGILELAADIYQRGRLLQIPIGCPSSTHVDGRWVEDHVALAFGHRRLRAYRQLHVQYPDDQRWAAMPVDVLDLDQQSLALYAWTENAQRQDISPLEQAAAIQRMSEHFHWTQDEIAKRLGIARPTVANKLRLLKLPPEAQAMLAAGQLSERQASALIPLYELPEVLLKNAETDHWRSPAAILKSAPTESSDMIRDRIHGLVASSSLTLADPWNGYRFEDAKHYQARNCNDCPIRLKLAKDKGWLCPDKACHAKKADSWLALRVAQASDETGYPIYVGSSDYGHTTGLSGENQDLVAGILKDGCSHGNLKIVGTAYGLHPKGFDDVSVVCAHGKGGYCKCLRQLKTVTTRADPNRQAELALEKAIQAEALQPAQRAIREAIQRGEVGVWLALMKKLAYGSEDNVAHDLAAIQERIAIVLLKWYNIGHDDRYSVKAARAALEKAMADMEIPAPWGGDQARYIAERLTRIGTWLHCTRELLAEPAVRGNLANLLKLSDQLVALGADMLPDLSRRITQLNTALLQILELYRVASPESWSARATILAHDYHEAGQWQAALDEAQVHELRYALCVMPAGDYDGRHRIEQRLAELSDVAPVDVLSAVIDEAAGDDQPPAFEIQPGARRR